MPFKHSRSAHIFHHPVCTINSVFFPFFFSACCNLSMLSVLLAMEERWWIARKEWQSGQLCSQFALLLSEWNFPLYIRGKERCCSAARLLNERRHIGLNIIKGFTDISVPLQTPISVVFWSSALLFVHPSISFSPQIMQVLLGISQPHKDQSHNSQISVKKKSDKF